MNIEEKYDGCLLPVIDEDLDVYVQSNYYNIDDDEPHLITKVEKVNDLVEYFSNSIGYNLYYSFSEADYDDAGKIGHFHAFSFDTVVRELYLHPETFSLSKDDIPFYSKQQLVYLNRLKRFLRIADLKDVTEYSSKELADRVKTEKVKELISYKQYNVKYGHEIMDGKVKRALGIYIDFKYKESEKILLSTINDDYIGIIEAKREVMKLDDITPDMIDYHEMGFETFDEYIDDFVKSVEDSPYSFDSERHVVYENYDIIKKIN